MPRKAWTLRDSSELLLRFEVLTRKSVRMPRRSPWVVQRTRGSEECTHVWPVTLSSANSRRRTRTRRIEDDMNFTPTFVARILDERDEDQQGENKAGDEMRPRVQLSVLRRVEMYGCVCCWCSLCLCVCVFFTVANCSNYGHDEKKEERWRRRGRDKRRRRRSRRCITWERERERNDRKNEIDFFSPMLTPFFLLSLCPCCSSDVLE